eukprot:TRINITY_DN10690_c0_g1_i3.p1 TRINITY_DN10690_c0_g1~~TRINITY_DN10690_c0_g1_i3.p1  ORF type:complete len:105 (-),score=21.26 TRINITY_DN10690_c0_g1_i3:128-442(-)
MMRCLVVTFAFLTLCVADASAITVATETRGADGKCRGQNRFDTMMCRSHMCTDCQLDWCMQECQKVQLDFPDCRCAEWPNSRKSYSGGEFKGKGKFGDVGDYSK